MKKKLFFFLVAFMAIMSAQVRALTINGTNLGRDDLECSVGEVITVEPQTGYESTLPCFDHPSGSPVYTWAYTTSAAGTHSILYAGKITTVKAKSATYALSVNPASLSFEASGGTESVEIASNVNWSVSSNATWATVSSSSGSNNGSINVSTSANTGTSSRTATITVSGNGKTATVFITQAGDTDTGIETIGGEIPQIEKVYDLYGRLLMVSPEYRDLPRNKVLVLYLKGGQTKKIIVN
jgi:hypothetical protein